MIRLNSPPIVFVSDISFEVFTILCVNSLFCCVSEFTMFLLNSLMVTNPLMSSRIHVFTNPPISSGLLEQVKLDLATIEQDEENTNDAESSSLEDLPNSRDLPKYILLVIADIKRMGAPKEKEGQGRKHGGKKLKKRERSARNNAARMEEQRRLRNQKESVLSQSSDAGEGDNIIGDPNDDDIDGGDYYEDGESRDERIIPMKIRLAAVVNSLRVLINIIRPMLNHPQRENKDLKMKHGPSISTDKKNRVYLFTKRVYCCASLGQLREIKRECTAISGELGVTLTDGNIPPKEIIHSIFNPQQLQMLTDEEHLVDKCMKLPSQPCPTNVSTLNNALMNRFENEHDEKQYMLQRSIERLQSQLEKAISRRFNGVRLTVYGSCLSGLALEGSHDVDISIFIPELHRLRSDFDNGSISGEEYQTKSKKIIFKVRDSLLYCREERFDDLFAVTRARVPVVKGLAYMQNPYTQDGHLSFDLCFLNDIAVVNSSLLREYSLFDNKVRILMLCVKSFAKSNGIASAADGTLSSYSWLNLVIFYLQCIGMVPVLQCPTLMEEHDCERNPNDRLHSVNGLNTIYLTKDIVTKKGIWQQSSHVKDTDIAMLLLGFFKFYSTIFPQATVSASIRFGKISLQKTCLSAKLGRISVEDPFEICSSHCPHDLGCHVKEEGQRKIHNALTSAKNMMSAMIRNGNTNNLNQVLGQPATPSETQGHQNAKRHQAKVVNNNGARHNNNINNGVKGRHNPQPRENYERHNHNKQPSEARHGNQARGRGHQGRGGKGRGIQGRGIQPSRGGGNTGQGNHHDQPWRNKKKNSRDKDINIHSPSANNTNHNQTVNKTKKQGGHQKQKNGGKANHGKSSAAVGEKVEKEKSEKRYQKKVNTSKIAEKKSGAS